MHDYTSYATLGHFEVEFEVEHIDMILGHYSEYRHSMSGLPILVLECSKRDRLEGAAHRSSRKIDLFQGKNIDEMD